MTTLQVAVRGGGQPRIVRFVVVALLALVLGGAGGYLLRGAPPARAAAGVRAQVSRAAMNSAPTRAEIHQFLTPGWGYTP